MSWQSHALTPVLLLGALGLLVQCTGPVTIPDTGSATFRITAADVHRVVVTVTAEHIEQPIGMTLAQDNGPDGRHWIGELSHIPAGPNLTFTAEAYDDADRVIYAGSADNVEIVGGETVTVMMVLQETEPAPPGVNSPPWIESLVLSAQHVAPGDNVRIVLAATDANGDDISIEWTATAGSFDDASSATPTWTAPEQTGPQTLTITLSDSNGGVLRVSVVVDVQTFYGHGGAIINVVVNTWPVVAQITTAPALLKPGQAATAEIDASDADGDSLSFSWTDPGGECAGSFDDATSASPVWTAPPATPSGEQCVLRVDISDGRGGSNYGEVTVYVSDRNIPIIPPRITSRSQTRSQGAPEQTIRFAVTAEDDQSDVLDFAWTANAGTFTSTLNDNQHSEVEWTIPYLCGEPAIVTVTITDHQGASTRTEFTITVLINEDEIDVPDPQLIDADCDGIDGDIGAAYFVGPDGDNSAAGSMEQPFATIQHALDRAADDPLRTQVLVAEGVYPEAIVLPDGVGLFGGYGDGYDRDTSDHVTVIDAPSATAVAASGISTQSHVQGFYIRSHGGSSGQSSIAVALADITGSVHVRNNHLHAGAGGPGNHGSSGAGGRTGGNGGAGAWPWIGGAAGGAAPSCPGHGGVGSSGGPGQNGRDGGSNGGGGGHLGHDLGGHGGAGGRGGNGSNGGIADGQARGSLSGIGWQASGGTGGDKAGCGGGGGSGGGNLCGVLPYVAVAGGGGGGGGGEGGWGGGAGDGAGGSFAVMAVNAGGSVIAGNTIETAGGGTGGNGGNGGNGGGGGGGGPGHPCGPGSGGNGGNGGPGGTGGGGSGGAGGMSVGILSSLSPALSITDNVYLLGSAGSGGSGGGSAPGGQTGIQAEQFVWD
ncbi:MAG: DUF1565 domain-containing protein [Proteobacteria bacterium]|nr:DUF1565 domain-containing protein [Pseudomonadota bacterium]